MSCHYAFRTVGGPTGSSLFSIFERKTHSLKSAQKVILVTSIERPKTAPVPPQPDNYASFSEGHGNSCPILVFVGNVGGVRRATEQTEGERCTRSRLVSPQIGRLPLLRHID